MEIQSGTLRFSEFGPGSPAVKGTSTGTFQIDAGAEILLGPTTDVPYVLGEGTVICGAGNFRVDRSVTVTGAVTAENFQLDVGGTLDIEIHTPTDFGRIVSSGNFLVNGTLDFSLLGQAPPVFRIIDKDGSDPVDGYFDGLPEGEPLLIGGEEYRITYVGGEGNNDVVLMAVNRPPVADAGGPYTVVRGGRVRLDALGTTDPDQATETLTYEWDFDGDGAFDDAAGIAPVFSVAGVETPETRTVAVQVTDNGGLSDVATGTVEIVVVALVPAACDPSKTALAVGGTAANDHIVFHPGEVAGDIVVQLNGVSLGTFQPTGRLVAFGQSGDDTIQVAGSIALSAWLYGDDGNDRVKGGAGNDVLFGGVGDDVLVGGVGRDLLIGGSDADRIVGNRDDDILIAGSTAYDANDEAICKIMKEWTFQDREFGVRVANLNGTGTGDRENGQFFLNTATVSNDGARDLLTGSAGLDWFIFNSDEDKATDLSNEEFADALDFILTEV